MTKLEPPRRTLTPTLKLQHALDPLASFVLAWLAHPKIAESKDVRFDELKVTSSSNGRILHMSGLVFHSALAVSDVKSRQSGSSIIVEVKLSPAKSGMSGHFEADIPLKPDTSRVLFGRELASVWEPAASPSPAHVKSWPLK